MKKYLKFIIPIGIFALVVSSGLFMAKAARPEKPIYPTVDEVQQMITDATASLQTAINNLGSRLSLVETAVTGNTQEIQNIKTSIPSPQPTPPFNLDMDITTQISRDNNPGFNYIGATVRVTSSAQTYSPFNVERSSLIPETNVWGVAHTPDGDINSAIFPTWYAADEFTILSFAMPTSYPYGTNIPIDVYAEYGGRVSHQTITPNTN